MSNAIEHTHNGTGHEHSEASVRLILDTVVVLVISVLAVCAIVAGIFYLFKSTAPVVHVSAMAPPVTLPGTPLLQEHPAEEISVLHTHEDDILNGYGWIDQNAGIVHIPIDKAIGEVVATLPVRPQTTARSQGGASGNRQ